MTATVHRIDSALHGTGAGLYPDADVKGHLAEALGTTLDSLAAGVVIVADKGRILHANQAARRMLDTKSPVLSLGGCLATLHAEATLELRNAIAAADAGQSGLGAGIGVPLVERDLTAATAHVLPLGRAGLRTGPAARATAAVFITRSEIGTSLPVDLAAVARSFRLTPAETRLLQRLLVGASLSEAAAALGVSEATARTHRNRIFMKTGVSRRTELLALIGRLVPPIRRVPSL